MRHDAPRDGDVPADVRPSTPFARALRALVERLPGYPPSLAAAVAVNLWLDEAADWTALAAANGKTVAIVVRDAGVRFTFLVQAEGIVACNRAVPDVTVAGAAEDFLALATRRVDPDTLFFARRITIEGDTALGHLLKNVLESWEPRLRLPTPARLLRALGLQLTGIPYPGSRSSRAGARPAETVDSDQRRIHMRELK